MKDSPPPSETMAMAEPRIDIHVHMVGNGCAESGCWFRYPWWKEPFAWLMAWQNQVPVSSLYGNLEAEYAKVLTGWVAASPSIDKVVLLAQEEVYSEEGLLLPDLGSAHVPNDFVFEMCEKYEGLLPAISIHPGRKDALRELERCINKGAVLLKLLPNCQNVDCNLPKYREFWSLMAEAGLPLLSHTGGEYTLQVVNADYSNPQVLRLPLDCGVKVIAAHCATQSSFWDPQYFHDLEDMMREYPHLYGDNSALNTPFRSKKIRETLDGPMKQRILHGSDYPVPIMGEWPWLRGMISWNDFRDCSNIENPIERDARLKMALGYKENTFTRANQILRL